MKNNLYLFLILIVPLSFFIFSCKKSLTGAPYDVSVPPTATPYYNINFTIQYNATPLAQATVVLVYPDASKSLTATADTAGKINFHVLQKGEYILNITHSSIPYSDQYPIFNSYSVVNGSNDYTINADAGSVTLVAQNPKCISYTADAAEYIYYLKYTSTMHRRLIPVLSSSMTSMASFITYIPPYIDASGTSITVKISVPAYYRGTSNSYNFPVAFNTNLQSAGVIYQYYSPMYANWQFDVSTSGITYNPVNGTLAGTMTFAIKNLDINHICLKIAKYEYFIDGQWVDYSYYGGVPAYTIEDFSNDVAGLHCFYDMSPPSIYGNEVHTYSYSFSLGYPGYGGNGYYGNTASTKGRLTLDISDNTNGALIQELVISN